MLLPGVVQDLQCTPQLCIKSERIALARKPVCWQVVDQPHVQLRSRSKLSCLSWNCFQESHLMSSDYEGVIMLWDTATLQTVTEYEAHNKRVWSVDFCPTHPQLLASGSDDGHVKVRLSTKNAQ